jgi:Zn-dependent M28 family amino/carboxypeptidase
MVHFVGANDGGSSTGFLIEFARVVSKMKHPDDIYIVFFDGEEAMVHWTDTDSLYGSRHLAAKWGQEGALSRIKALINIDMIGDKQLDVVNDANSSQSLRDLIWKVAAQHGDAQYFHNDQGGVDDDHMPFANSGVNAVDIIDLNYGPNNSYWHTAQDTMDKVSAHSLQVIGDVVTATVEQLEQK